MPTDWIIAYRTGIVSYLTSGLAFVNVVLICNCFLGDKFKQGRPLMFIFGGYAVFGLIPIPGKTISVFDLPFYHYVIMFLIFVFLSKEKKLLKRIFGAILLPAFVYCLGEYGPLINSAFFSLIMGNYEIYLLNMISGEGLFAYISLSLGLFGFQLPLFLVLYFRVYRKGIRMKIRPWIVAGFALWMYAFSWLASIPFITAFSNYSQAILNGYIIAMLTLFGVAVPILIVYLIYSVRLRERIASQNSYLKAELDYIEQYKKKEQETRAFRHDMINQLSLLDMNLAAGRREECLEHLEELLGKARGFSPRFNTGDEMLDCIVSMKYEKMEEAGITFSCDGVCDGGLGLKPTDICCIFANALDNAIEACVAEREKRKTVALKDSGTEGAALSTEPKAAEHQSIDLKITRTPAFFVFKLSNPCDENLDAASIYDPNVVVTSKKDTRHHGFGTKNLLRVVNSYGGMVKAERQDKTFVLGITLPRKEVL